MAIVKRNADGRRLQSVVGARGIGFDQPRDQNYIAYGYPQLAPFDGKLEYTCPSAYEGSDSAGSNGPATMAISCDMTAGASGGGWIIGDKTLVSVTSYGYDTRPGFLYGPYLLEHREAALQEHAREAEEITPAKCSASRPLWPAGAVLSLGKGVRRLVGWDSR